MQQNRWGTVYVTCHLKVGVVDYTTQLSFNLPTQVAEWSDIGLLVWIEFDRVKTIVRYSP